jgi:hypothetical protein
MSVLKPALTQDDIMRMVACVEREIEMRKRVYPRWVSDKRMSQSKADEEIRTMVEVLGLVNGVGHLVNVMGQAKADRGELL